ncbi:MAG: hypothetical protein HY403_04880 [Elusimicrobia bacterium]|nr:hypothetical protein [Elusimicrobiota bacterium]
MRRVSGLLAMMSLLAAPASAYAPLGYPGAIWGNASRDFSGFEGWGVQSWIKQGVTWTMLPGEMPLQTFAYYRVRSRTQNRPYFDAHGPALSAEISKDFLSLGTDFHWQRYPELGLREDHHELFAAWYKRVDLARGHKPALFGGPLLGVPLSTWGRLTRDLDGIEGNGTQGWVQQGVDIIRLPGAVLVTPFAAYRWRLRSENRRYFNVHGPAAGLEFGRGPMQLGLEQAWRYYPELKRTERAIQAYLTWFYEWDLTRR